MSYANYRSHHTVFERPGSQYVHVNFAEVARLVEVVAAAVVGAAVRLDSEVVSFCPEAGRKTDSDYMMGVPRLDSPVGLV